MKDLKPGGQLQGGLAQQGVLSQKLIMSAHMQQAIRLLQIPLQELEPLIEEQIAQNPLLETWQEGEGEPSEENERSSSTEEEKELVISDRDLSILSRLEEDFRDHFTESEQVPIKRSLDEEKQKAYLEQSISRDPSLPEQLFQQAHDSFETEKELAVAELLIGYLDHFGFLVTPLSEIAALHPFTEEELFPVLEVIKTFEPFGVGASSLQESFLIQLRCLGKKDTLAYRIIQDHYEELLHNQIPTIQKELKIPLKNIQEAIEKDIAKLDLHPGTQCSSEPNQMLIADVTLREENDELVVAVERDHTPNLRLNRRYMKLLEDPSVDSETKTFIKHHLFSARWLVRNLQHRFSTIERIAEVLSKKQRNFFMNPDGQLVPLTMQQVADELGLHESTVARTVANKHLFSPQGLLPLRSFFTTKYTSEEGDELSSSTVRNAILDLLAKEDKQHPLSDEKISVCLKENGILCARRTVAKYRSLLHIGNTQQRKKFG